MHEQSLLIYQVAKPAGSDHNAGKTHFANYQRDADSKCTLAFFYPPQSPQSLHLP